MATQEARHYAPTSAIIQRLHDRLESLGVSVPYQTLSIAVCNVLGDLEDTLEPGDTVELTTGLTLNVTFKPWRIGD